MLPSLATTARLRALSLGFGLALAGCDVDVRLGAVPISLEAGDAPTDASASDVTDGGCGDTSASSLNCGRCGHSCLGTACVSGKCTSLVLASGLSRPDWLALDATDVYFTCNGKSGVVGQENEVDKVSLQGTGFQVLRSEPGLPAALVLDATSVYWTEQSVPGQDSMIRKIAKTGGSVTPVANAVLGTAQGLARDGNELFWAGNTAVRRALTTDNTTFGTDWLTGINGAWGVALSPTRLYVTSGGPQNFSVVDRATKGVVSQTALAGTAFDVFVDGQDVYVTTGVAVFQLDLGGNLVATLDSGFIGGLGITADAERVYWSNDTGIHARRRDLQGGVEDVADWSDVGHLVLDGSWLYFTRHASGEVRKIAR